MMADSMAFKVTLHIRVRYFSLEHLNVVPRVFTIDASGARLGLNFEWHKVTIVGDDVARALVTMDAK